MKEMLHPDTDSCHCRRGIIERTNIHLFYLTNDLIPLNLLILNLPVELGVFYKYVAISVSNEHFTADTSETFRVVLLLSSNLFHKGGPVSLLMPLIVAVVALRAF